MEPRRSGGAAGSQDPFLESSLPPALTPGNCAHLYGHLANSPVPAAAPASAPVPVPALPSSSLPGHCPARLQAPLDTGVRPDTGCAHPGIHLLSALCSSVCKDLTHDCAPAACPANFSSLFLFSFQQNGASHRQALQELSANPRPALHQIPAARRPFDSGPPGPTQPARLPAGSRPLGPLPPAAPAGTHRSAPNSAARGRVPRLRATRTCPWRRSGRESKRVGPEGPGAGRGAAEHGASRAPEPVGGWGPAGNEGASEVGCSFYSRAERVT